MRRVFIVLAKLMGLLQIYWGLTFLTSVVMIFAHMPGGEGDREFAMQLLGVCIYGVVAFGAAWLLLARTEWLADRLGIEADSAPVTLSKDVVLQAGMKLIGVYFLTRALPSLVRGVMQVSRVGDWGGSASALWTTTLPTVLQIVLALLLLIRTRWILGVIAKGEAASGKRIAVGGIVILGVLLLLGHMVYRNRWGSGIAGRSSSVTDTYYEDAVPCDEDAESRTDGTWLSLEEGTNGAPTNALSHFAAPAAAETSTSVAHEVEIYVPL